MNKPFIRAGFLLTFLNYTVGCQQKSAMPGPLEAGWRGKSFCQELIYTLRVRIGMMF